MSNKKSMGKAVNIQIENNFTYHKPTEIQVSKMTHLRLKAKDLALAADDACIPCREKSSAMTKLEEFIMHINAGIVRNP